MVKSKTYFEQLPVSVVKQIAQEESFEGTRPVVGNASGRLPALHLVSQSEKSRHRMELPRAVPTCELCGQPVALETCMIDEKGQAVHEKCAVARMVANQPAAAFRG